MRLKADPGNLRGEVSINLPGSKSIHNRLLIIQKLSGGKVDISGNSQSEDTKFLNSALNHSSREMFMGEGGTALRFGLAWAAITPGERVIDGSKRLRERPIRELVEVLNDLGADIKSVNGDRKLPLLVKGRKLEGGKARMTQNISSQFISALLMIAPYTKKGISIELPNNQVSMPYIRMTVELMKRAGAKLSESGSEIVVHPAGYKPSSIQVEKDWSSASYFFEWVLFNENLQIELPGLSLESVQGDAQIVHLFKILGVEAREENGSIVVRKAEGSEIKEMDFLEVPDMAQSLAVAAAGIQKRIRLTGLQTLRVKETDRISALKSELLKVGVQCSSTDSSLEIESFKDPDPNVSIKTFRDHRMAMAFAPLASKLGEIEIQDPSVVAKSFPDYWNEIQKLGVEIIKI